MKRISLLVLLITVMVACSKDNASVTNNGSVGKGGSLARFSIVGNYLYMVDNTSLITYDITNAINPVLKNKLSMAIGIETIYPYKDKLFIGSRDGMYIYDLKQPDLPVLLGTARHVRSCDPVVANDSIAYVTLRSGTPCGTVATDALFIYNVKNLLQPTEIKSLALSTPYGLGIKDSTLFVCRGDSGMSLVNVKKPEQPVLVRTIKDGVYYDVIPIDNLLICQVKTGLILYDIADVSNMKMITKVDN